ncbi:Tetraspanin-2 [Galemys pyrenaicus]|uniref:Tetraspanin-2 n=1 Tax=Galemys pyrenaicus TaxID=202257 RepID=A0A8J6AER7_GALPY|nr:Tetraspanin-2 [Galemys pyrenaicus]
MIDGCSPAPRGVCRASQKAPVNICRLVDTVRSEVVFAERASRLNWQLGQSPGAEGPPARGKRTPGLAGSAVIAFGLWFRFGGAMKDFSSEDKSPEYFYVGLYVLVGAGALMMAVGFFGCCGAMRESQCVLGSAIRHVQTMYEDAYREYLLTNKGNGTLITFHSTFQCCGKESPSKVQSICPTEPPEHKNCIDEIEAIISVKLQLIGIVGIGIAGLTVRKF